MTNAGFAELHWAAIYGKDESVSKLIRSGADVNARGVTGATPLHFAAIGGSVEVATSLIQAGATVDFRSEGDMTPLHVAATANRSEVLDVLLQAGADVKSKCKKYNITPLHLAGLGGSERIINSLIDAGADIDAQTNNELTALHAASAAGNFETAQTLVSCGANIEAKATKGFTPLLVAACGSLNVVEPFSMLSLSDWTMRGGPGILAGGAQKGYRDETVSMLIEFGAQITTVDSERFFSAFHWAAVNGGGELAMTFLKTGANGKARNKSGFSPVEVAVINGNVEFISSIMNYRSNI